MKIADIPQTANLAPLFPSPSHLVRPVFVGNAIVHDGYNGKLTHVALWEDNADRPWGETRIVAVLEFGTSFSLYCRKPFNLNCCVADDIAKQSNVASVVFRSEWL